MKLVIHGYVRSFWVVCALWALAACTTGQVVDHAFTFDVLSDSPGVELLDYRYGDSRFPAASNPAHHREKGTALQRINISGRMVRGDSLYVKWRSKATGQVFEETADLHHRLPSDISGHRLYFMIQADRLYVYLIPPESKKRPAESPPNGPRMYRDLDVVTIYQERKR